MSERAVVQSSFARWKRPVYDLVCLDDFLELSDIKDGIHRISCGGLTLDVLIQGFENARLLAKGAGIIGFAGAIIKRDTTFPPYFAGLGTAEKLDCPFIAFSDIALLLDKTLRLGWYAGNSEAPYLAKTIARIIDRIAERYGIRFVLFGGSGGGFAVLAISSYLACNATAIAWNAQTCIAKYMRKYALHYVRVAFPKMASEAFMLLKKNEAEAIPLIHDLFNKLEILSSVVDIERPKGVRVLYLQNRDDWHVHTHAKPFLGRQGWRRLGVTSFAQGEELALHIGNWGSGHVPPPVDLIVQVVAKAFQNRTVVEIAAELATMSSADDYCQWFTADLPDSGIKPQCSCAEIDGQLRIAIEIQELSTASNLEYALSLIKSGNEQAFFEYQPSKMFTIPIENMEADAVRVFVRDFWHETRMADLPIRIERR